jgi:Cupin domain
MLLETLAAATAAALFALSTATFVQGSSGQSGSPAATGASTDVPAKCVGLTGTERDKCLLEQRSGTGEAMVNGKRHRLRAGTLLLIERCEKHEVRNTGRGLLRTLNFYAPPAYRKDGNPLSRGKR